MRLTPGREDHHWRRKEKEEMNRPNGLALVILKRKKRLKHFGRLRSEWAREAQGGGMGSLCSGALGLARREGEEGKDSKTGFIR